MKYEVTIMKIVNEKYLIDAKSKEEAIRDADTKGQYIGMEYTGEVAADLGISFDEAFDEDIDLDFIRSEYNSDRRLEHIEGLRSIRKVPEYGVGKDIDVPIEEEVGKEFVGIDTDFFRNVFKK